jgi:hypothetical protein
MLCCSPSRLQVELTRSKEMESARPRRDRDDGPRRGPVFPPLSTGLRLAPGFDPDANADAPLPYHRLYLQNVAFSLTESDIRAVFEPFGQIEFVDQHVDHVSWNLVNHVDEHYSADC